jgi:hypothetical protein
MPDGPLTPEGLRVCAGMCSTCVFRPGNPMHLRPGRVQQMVRDSIRDDSFIPCHKTLDGQQAVCRGFFDAYGDRTLGCRLGHYVGLIEVTPEG